MQKGLDYILRAEYSSSRLQQDPASWVWTAVRDALWYLRSRDAGDQTLWEAQHLSLSVTPSGKTSAERLAAGKCSHDRVKTSRLISDYSAFSVALLHGSAPAAHPPCDLCLTTSAGNQPLDSGMKKGSLLTPAIFKRHLSALKLTQS